jgi:hypothetical protein
MDTTVAAAGALAISSAFSDHAPTFKPTGSAADTAFSGSAVLELALDPPPPNDNLVVLKHSAVRNLNMDPNDPKYAAAVKVDQSSRNECCFLQAYSSQLLERNIKIPRTLFARNDPNEGVTLLMESLSTWNQLPELPLGLETDSALKWLANFHAAFLPKALNSGALSLSDLVESGGWSTGTHLSLEKRPPKEIESLEEDLSAFAARFEAKDAYFVSSSAREQGARLQAVVADAATALLPANHAHQTMVHGDYKHGNFFFGPSGEIAVFDWQWTGPGVGATDLIYLCAMAVCDDALEDHEANILRPYHAHLIEALGGEETCYPYEELLTEFKIAALDYQRWQGGSRLKWITPETMKAAGENVDVNHGIFRRSIKRMVWIFETVDSVLDDVEAGRLTLG